MQVFRPAPSRGHTQTSWLNSRHTFSFGRYQDTAHQGFCDLLVINEDHVAAGQGFGEHSHKNMEIISYVLEGEMIHKDSLGNGSVIKPGDIQRMSAGRGIRHSEFNASQSQPLHFVQIWIKPAEYDLSPSYEQKTMPSLAGQAQMDLIGSSKPDQHSILIHQNINLYRVVLPEGQTLNHIIPTSRHIWVQAVRGDAIVNGQKMKAGDGLALSDEKSLIMQDITSLEPFVELLVFDLQ